MNKRILQSLALACAFVVTGCSKQVQKPMEDVKQADNTVSEFADAIMLKAHTSTGEPLYFFDEKGTIPQGLDLALRPKRIPTDSYQPAQTLSYWMTLGENGRGLGERYRNLCSRFPSVVTLPDDQKHCVSFYWQLHPGPQVIEAYLEGHETPVARIEAEVKPGTIIDLPVPPFTFIFVSIPPETWSGPKAFIPERWHLLVRDGAEKNSFAWNVGDARKGWAWFWAVHNKAYSGWVITKSTTDDQAKTTMLGYAFKPFQIDKSTPRDPDRGMIDIQLQMVDLDKPPILVPYP